MLDESLVVHHCVGGVGATPGLQATKAPALGCTSLYAGSWGEWYKTQELAVEMSIKVSVQQSILRLSGATAPQYADDKTWLAD